MLDISTDCASISHPWTRPSVLSERFSSSATYQYFQYRARPNLNATFVHRLFGDNITNDEAVRLRVDELDHADYTDVDFDAISSTITFTAVWSPVASAENLNATRRASGTIQGSGADQRIEVGVLHSEKAKEPEELSLGGFLTVIGDNDHPGTWSVFISRAQC